MTAVKKLFERLAALVCAAVLLMSAVAFAAAPEALLTLECSVGGTAVPGAACRLYRVASLSGTSFTLAGAFGSAAVDLTSLSTADAWQTAADALAAYAAAENAAPTATGQTDAAGRLAFAGLQTGLYLAVFDDTVRGGTTYRFAPTLLSLPQWDSTGRVSYDLTAQPKGSASTPPSAPATVSVTVLKIWNDRGSSAARPKSITVSLLQDGRVVDTVTLSAANHWRHSWSGLSAASVWRAAERGVPSGYTVSYRASGTVLTVTNTKRSGTRIPDDRVPLGSLPNTGLLWWPVPLLAVCGLALFGAGWWSRRHEE
mgnify:CR=1 FL=1